MSTDIFQCVYINGDQTQSLTHAPGLRWIFLFCFVLLFRNKGLHQSQRLGMSHIGITGVSRYSWLLMLNSSFLLFFFLFSF